MKKTPIIYVLMFSLLLYSCFAALVTYEDFETGWTPGFNYGEIIANGWTCNGDIDCSPSGTLGAGGVQIIDETDGPKYLRIYSAYTTVNSNTKTGKIFWNLSAANSGNTFYNYYGYGFSFNMRISDMKETYSDLYNKFVFTAYKSQSAGVNRLFNNQPFLTTPSNTYGGMITNWDFESHNELDYPYTFTSFNTNYANAIDEASTSEFKTHGKCWLDEDEWGTVFILYKIAINDSGPKRLEGETIYINGVQCLDINISYTKQVDTLSFGDFWDGISFFSQNQDIDIDNVKLYKYSLKNDPLTVFDVINNSIITEPGSPYSPVDDSDYSLSHWFATYGLIFALLMVSIMVMVGAKFAGPVGGIMMGIFTIIVFGVMGWLPLWVILIVVVAVALAFAYFMSGIFQGGS
jgi:hypothetical protein